MARPTPACHHRHRLQPLKTNTCNHDDGGDVISYDLASTASMFDPEYFSSDNSTSSWEDDDDVWSGDPGHATHNLPLRPIPVDARGLQANQQRFLSAASTHHVRVFPKLVNAMDAREGVQVVFATEKEICTGDVRRCVRQYLVGAHLSLFRLAHAVDWAVPFEEVIVSDKPCNFHVDVEIKRIKTSLVVPAVVVLLMEQQWSHFLIEFRPGQAKTLLDSYLAYGKEPWQNTDCKTGCRVVLNFIKEFIVKTLVDHPDNRVDIDNFAVVSGCRLDKFSLHISTQGLCFDSNLISGGAFVYEMARNFWKDNVVALLAIISTAAVPFDLSGDLEFRFRVRALMVMDGVEQTRDTQCDDVGLIGGWGVRGWGDTPLDEVIYSRNHSLRARGCCRRGMATVVPAFGPFAAICVACL